ncbi:GNAT family N-acetyltransferase [Staphylococcus delphini]|uniref:GNAT family N-acetyltransferase n=1 Tax=Staphylococcus delphini TaxID=53344 RepID=A0AAQ0D7N3_9STAP|nr:GNAT family N-acetyltransferase [Staphylococcus delphini]MDE9829082.1 GNAT family N-acetyltransferase [Staphylococcus delphini]PCF36525.1 GNAT family N-acetyltransferase [Staphylococcus delphini]PCF50429.1 GNAT family N-acetyltransferase [Staphylococcus delphini]PCF54814.1 GNAT family N-acetyltransferase [Staphylococcus delphini]PCF57950.1 GNAT family N-acetyltransferase [Staphylococcus delphini]
MGYELRKVTVTEVATLQQISKDTFYAAYRDDYEQALFDSYFAEEMSIEKLTSEIEDPDMHFFFLYHDDAIVGYVKVNVEAAQTVAKGIQYAELQRIYLYPDYQGQGLGQRLFDFVCNFVKNELGKPKLWLGVWEENSPALNFYLKQGLVKTGVHPFKMGGHIDEDWIMEKDL